MFTDNNDDYLHDRTISFLLREYHLGFFFFNDTATTEIYTLSLHDALPISSLRRHGAAAAQHRQGLLRGARPQRPLGRPRGLSRPGGRAAARREGARLRRGPRRPGSGARSEEHTSELQSRLHLVCRLLLEKK